jgi:aryl-alcohol dehydrogenase-like predicted oxidoreductase
VEQRQLGKGGPMVSLVGLGCNNFGGRIDAEASRKVIHKALDLGITFFDTADSYGTRGGSEECLGRFLGERRKHIVLGTKFGLPFDGSPTLQGASPRYIKTAVEASLARLKTDWIDLYQLHRPDPQTPIADTLAALNDLIRQGKVRTIGCSNLSAVQVTEAQQTAQQLDLHAFVGCQDEYSLLVRKAERELIPTMQRHGLGLVPYFPLAGGMLTGKYERNAGIPPGTRLARLQHLAARFLTPANFSKVEQLSVFCAQRGRALVQLASSWIAAQPLVASVIAGASTTEQLEENVRAVDWKLTPEELAEIDRITREA